MSRSFVAAERLGDFAGDRLHFVFASVAEEPMLEPAQAAEEPRVLFEDRVMPEDRARRVAPIELVEIGQALVGLDAGAGVFGVAGLLDEAFGQIGGERAAGFVALGGEPSKGLSPCSSDICANRAAWSNSPRRSYSSAAMRASRARSGPGRERSFAPKGRFVGGRFGRESLVEVAQRQIAGPRARSLLEQLFGAVEVLIGNEKSFADPIEGLLDRVVGAAPPFIQPLDDGGEIAASACARSASHDAKGETGRAVVRLFEEACVALGISALAGSVSCLEQDERCRVRVVPRLLVFDQECRAIAR